MYRLICRSTSFVSSIVSPDFLAVQVSVQCCIRSSSSYSTSCWLIVVRLAWRWGSPGGEGERDWERLSGGGGGEREKEKERGERGLPQRICHRFLPSCFFFLFLACKQTTCVKTNHFPGNRVTVNWGLHACATATIMAPSLRQWFATLRIACACASPPPPPPFVAYCTSSMPPFMTNRIAAHPMALRKWNVLPWDGIELMTFCSDTPTTERTRPIIHDNFKIFHFTLRMRHTACQNWECQDRLPETHRSLTARSFSTSTLNRPYLQESSSHRLTNCSSMPSALMFTNAFVRSLLVKVFRSFFISKADPPRP